MSKFKTCALILIIYQLNYFINSVESNFRCGEYEFQCISNDKCINSSLVCNDIKDCEDNSDENDCDKCMEPEWFECKGEFKSCIHHSFVCDGSVNCLNGEDEENCQGNPKTKETCNKFEFSCEDKSCIPKDMMCDGKKDCRDNSDETIGCEKAELNCDGFFCLNKICLASHSWVCDGQNDCGDNSDEMGCAWNCKLEENKFLCKDNHSCIALNKVCDGEPDCSDKSDENGKCDNKELSCGKCPSKCVNLPTGAVCVCPKGFTYNDITEKCDDVDECKEFGICSQICTNTNGSYECSCNENYKLKDDNRTCFVEGGEPFLLFTSKTSIVKIDLYTKRISDIVKDLEQAIGVAFDGTYTYWTQIKNGQESIVRSKQNGVNEILVSSGLEAPEDLAIDWLTGNIYFTDNVKRFIAVCTNHGDYCKALVQIEIDSPRGIALHPQNGQMYWSDWGDKPMIATSKMDGSDVKPLINTNIKWPNCIVIDYPNNRLYWVDAKIPKIEHVKLDGTDRRTISSDVISHPYGIAIFAEHLYWTDWSTKTVNVCDKLNGKNHEVLFKGDMMYAAHIFHPSLQPNVNHPCKYNSCSHICLLSGKFAKCACPDDMDMNLDNKTCVKVKKTEKLYVGISNNIYEIEHTEFGRHRMTGIHPLPIFISKMEFNTINGTIFVADNLHLEIAEYNLVTKNLKILVSKNLANITALAFDHLTHNLYWADSKLHTIEVLSLQTGKRALIHYFSGKDKPIGLAIRPQLGHLYVAVQSPKGSYISTLTADGHIYHSFSDKLGNGRIQLYAGNKLYWLDEEMSKIEYTDYENISRNIFRDDLKKPISMTMSSNNVFWNQHGSTTIFWTYKTGFGAIKRFQTDQPLLNINSKIFGSFSIMASKPIIISSSDKHRCLTNNGGCSHICVATGTFSSLCVCPKGYVFSNYSNKTCIDANNCDFLCISGDCFTASQKCNGVNDCIDGSDEIGCEGKLKKICNFSQFRCHDGTKCIEHDQRCDKTKNCDDYSDERDCENFDTKTKCLFNQFRCDNSRCVDINSVCDKFDDCGDNSDEKLCDRLNTDNKRGCDEKFFQCAIGTCIPKSWECDGPIDCIDGSDEHEKCIFTCSKDSIQCRSGTCIDLKFKCDGNNDCGDNSDETDCKESKNEKIVCSDELDSFGDKKKFQCTSNINICLDISAKCNGTAECPRGEDEFNCSTCSIYEFKCTSIKQCIRNEWLCDGTKDCDDGTDELNCKHLQNKTSINPQFRHRDIGVCHGDMFNCKDGTCIEKLKVCDGIMDCENGSDENSLCKTSCNDKHECQHSCTPTPYGAVCSCRSGYRLNNDRKTCSDIDECHEGNPCSQICENFDGEYRCSCYSEFMLQLDKVNCKSIHNGAYILFSSFDQVRIITENPISIKFGWSANESKIIGLDVNVANNKAYFTIKDSNNIFEYNLNKSTNGIERILIDPGRKKKIAVDWITGNIYVVANTGVDNIKVCNFDNKKCARIIKSRARDSIKTIAVDAINRHLFYTTTYFSIFGNPKTTLYKVTLDGQQTTVLLSNSMYISAIELDIYKKIVYFIDFHTKTLQSINYNADKDNTKEKIIIKKENAIQYPSDLSIYENRAYIINTASSQAVQCDLFGENKCKAFNINVYNAENIIIVSKSRQPKVNNFCQSNKCSVLCVHGELGAKCICYNGERSAVGESCPLPIQETELSNLDDINELTNETTESETSISLIVFTFIIIILICCVIGYIYYRKKYNPENVLINMHFQNPLSKNSNSNNNGNNQQEISQQNQFNQSPSVSTRFYKNNDNKNSLTNKIQKFFNSEKYSEISMESSETRRQQHNNKQTVKGSNSFTYKTGNSMESKDHEYTSRDLGNFDDDPRAHLVPQ